MTPTLLPESLVDEVYERLGPPARPTPKFDGLSELYAAWCRHVPFDNIRKRIHLDAGDAAPLPGSDPAEFFRAWLEHATGGTCFPTSGGLAPLLESCGAELSRVVSAMLSRPDDRVREDHGTLIVHVDGEDYFVDTSDAAQPSSAVVASRPRLNRRPAASAHGDAGGRTLAYRLESSPRRRIHDLSHAARPNLRG